MKEIISAVLLIVTLFGGSVALKNIHDVIRKAALEKAAKGLPSLEGMSRALRRPPKPAKKPDQSRQERVNTGQASWRRSLSPIAHPEWNKEHH